MRSHGNTLFDTLPKLILLLLAGLLTSISDAKPVTYTWAPDEPDGSLGTMVLSYDDTDPSQSDSTFSGALDFINWKSPLEWAAPYQTFVGAPAYAATPYAPLWSAVDGTLVDGSAYTSASFVNNLFVFGPYLTFCDFWPSNPNKACVDDDVTADSNLLLQSSGQWVLQSTTVPDPALVSAPALLFGPGFLILAGLASRKKSES